MNDLHTIIVSTLSAAAMMLIVPVANARDQVHWSVNIGSPYYAPSPIVYVQPRAVYAAPVQYVEPSYYIDYSQPYYAREVVYERRHHWKHHRHEN
jgi:hypothetical protein